MEYFEWGNLGTYAGAVTITAIITQYVKQIPLINKIHTQILSYIIAVLIIEAAAFFNGTWTWSVGVLCLVNAVIISLGANGTYDAITAKVGGQEYESLH